MSLIEVNGEYSSTCGYCKSEEESMVSYGMYAHRMTVEHYQGLIDRGWRRSGKFLYKPNLEKSCCPPYTIRLPASEFRPSKEQKRVLRKMQKYLESSTSSVPPDAEYDHQMDGDEEGPSCPVSSIRNKSTGCKEIEKSLQDIKNSITSLLLNCITNFLSQFDSVSFNLDKLCNLTLASKKVREKLKLPENTQLLTANAAFQISAALRKAGKTEEFHDSDRVSEILTEKLKEQDISGVSSISHSAGHLNFYVITNSGKGEELKLKDPVRKLEKVAKEEKSIQETDTTNKRFQILTFPSKFDEEEFQLYKKYQTIVHEDKESSVTKMSYKRFLVDTPLVFVPSSSVPSGGYGSFHQQYRINGKLIAVGVVDILPFCLSSKYLFWDPDFAFLSLGRFSALKEIEWVQTALSSGNDLLAHYYLGYYIHSCPKMKYKAQYSPSYLLCPLRNIWFPYKDVVHLFEVTELLVFSRPPEDQNNSRNEASSSDTPEINHSFVLSPSEERELQKSLTQALGSVHIVIDGHLMTLNNLLRLNVLTEQSIEMLADELMDYGTKVGVNFMVEARYILNPQYFPYS